MEFSNFDRTDWINYLAKIKVNEDGLLSDVEQEAYDKFISKKNSDEKEKSIYHEKIQQEVDCKIIEIARKNSDIKDLEMYKIYSDKLYRDENVEEDEAASNEFEW